MCRVAGADWFLGVEEYVAQVEVDDDPDALGHLLGNVDGVDHAVEQVGVVLVALSKYCIPLQCFFIDKLIQNLNIS